MDRNKNYSWQEQKTYEMPDDLVPATRQRVLLLEDEVELARTLKELLEACRFDVDVVANGAEGLKLILTRDYDVIVCDMIMPGFPGDMFYLAVQRAKPALCRRFIFTTGHRADPKIDQFIRQVKGFMVWKPFQPHELIDAVQSVAKRSGIG